MLHKSTFENKRATVTITRTKKISQVRRWENFERMAKARKHLNSLTDLSIEQRKEIGQEINHYRKLINKTTWGIYNFKVVLKDPIFQGFEYTSNLELPDDKAAISLKNHIKEQINYTIKCFRLYKRPKAKDYMADFGPSALLFYGSQAKGRVFSKPEQVLQTYVQKNMKTMWAEKKPVVSNRYVGVELEFCAPISETRLAMLLFKAGVDKFAQLKKDGSLRPLDGETGFELAILLREDKFRSGLKKITEILKKVKATATDRRCGMHVHVDMRRRDKDTVYNNLVACQDALLKIVDPSRNDNEFCRLVTSRKFPVKFTGTREERYKTINAAAYYKYQTIEIRMHEGSVDYKPIVGWVNLLLKIVNHKKKLKYSISELTVLKERFKLNKKLTDYAIDRSCYFMINNNSNRTRAIPRPELNEQLNEVVRETLNRIENSAQTSTGA